MTGNENTVEIKQTGRKGMGAFRMWLLYSVLFAVLVAGVYGVLILTHRSVIQYGDGFRQGYFTITECKRQLQAFRNGQGFQFWSWSIGPGMDVQLGSFLDPFNWIAALFPMEYLELGYTFAGILKLYFGGLSFIAVTGKTGLSDHQRLIGSLCYVFSAWFISTSLIQNSFLFNAYLFPLLVLGVERAYKDRKPLLFILVVAYYMARSIYFAYMAAFTIVIYIPFRYFAYYDRFSFGTYFANLGRFCLYGITGMLISAVVSVESIVSLTGASMESTAEEAAGFFFQRDFYESLGVKLVGRGLTTDYVDIGIMILIWLLLPVAVRYIRLRKTNVIMVVILTFMLFTSFFCGVYNGFGYPTLRWVFILIFFACWSSAEVLDPEILSKWSNIVLMFLMWILLAAWTVGFRYMGFVSFKKNAEVFIPVQLIVGLGIIVYLILRRKKGGEGQRTFRTVITCLVILSLSCGWTYAFYNNHDSFFRNNTIYGKLKGSVQRAGNRIEDDGFYRIDQVDGANSHQEMKIPVNENLYWQIRTLYTYNSRLSDKLLKLNKLVGNNYGYSERVYMLSNDNRMGLDFLYGVKYFLGSDYLRNSDNGSDQYAGYGFEPYKIIDEVNVLRNKHDPGLGFVYTSYLPESEFMKLTRLEREQALLQAAVVPDDELDEVPQDGVVRAEDLEFDIKDVPYEVTGTDGITFRDGCFEADKEDASFTVRVENAPAGQIIVSFDHLLRDSGETEQTRPFLIYCDNGTVRKMARNEDRNQTIPNICDYDFNMGYHEAFSGEITVRVTHTGTYTYDRLYLSSMSAENYDKYADRCEAGRLRITLFENERVEGTVSGAEDGVLFLSIPSNRNWKVTVDGKKVQKVEDLNVAFFGVPVPSGTHGIVVYYRNTSRLAGAAVSVLGLVILAITGIAEKRAKKRAQNS